MRFTQIAALMVLPFILGGTSCAQTSKEKQKHAVVRVTTHDGAWLGVSLSDMTPKTAKEMEAKTESGALVRSVSEDSPAEKAGIEENDIVIEFNGKPIADSDDLVKAVGGAKAGETVDIVVMRKDDKKSLKATLGEAPAPPEPMVVTVPHAPDMKMFMRHAGQASYGLSLRTLNRQLGEYFGAPGGHGVLIEEVRKKSPAAEAGFKAGDVIVKVGDETVESVGEVREALGEFKKGETANIAVLRKGNKTTLKLSIKEKSVGSFYHVEPSDINYDFNFDVPTPHPFDEEAFQIKMKKFGEEMKEMGKKLKEQLKGVEEKLRMELRRVSEI